MRHTPSSSHRHPLLGVDPGRPANGERASRNDTLYDGHGVMHRVPRDQRRARAFADLPHALARTCDDNIRRALIMVHGTNRNADHYFTPQRPPRSSPARSTTPSSSRRASHRERQDALPQRSDLELSRRQLAIGRHVGQPSGALVVRLCRRAAAEVRQQERLSRTCARSSSTGHSAGGQFATRYAMANEVHDIARRARDLCRRQSVELCVAGCDATAADRTMRIRRPRRTAGA